MSSTTYCRPIAPRAHRPSSSLDFTQAFAEMRSRWKTARTVDVQANYAAAKSDELRRTRLMLGGTADAHYYIWREYWDLRERARDFDRNDIIVAQAVDRSVDNIIGTGFHCDPQPAGDKKLAGELRDDVWEPWWRSPQALDVARRHSGRVYTHLTKRHQIVDGDCFVRLFWSGPHKGKLQFLEGDRIDSPGRVDDALVHGVEIDDFGAPLIYHVLKHKATQQKWRRYYVPDVQNKDAYDAIPALDRQGRPNILHFYQPERFTQTRGITAFHAVFDYLGMLEDVQFAKLVQQQVVSCVSAFITSDRDIQIGPREETTEDVDGTSRFDEGLRPGKILGLNRGEGMQAFSPNVPNPEYFQHVTQLLRLIGAALGLPLEVFIFDVTQTTYHGYRGALQQAYLGWRRHQQHVLESYYLPLYHYRMELWLTENYAAFRQLERGSRKWRALLQVRFVPPSWPYVKPSEDAQADVTRITNMLESPRHIVGERGRDWDDVVAETIEDRSSSIELAIERAAAIETKTGVIVDWREVLGRGVQLQGQIEGPDAAVKREKAAADAERSRGIAEKSRAQADAEEQKADLNDAQADQIREEIGDGEEDLPTDR